MSTEDNLNYLKCKDNTISEMKNQTKADQVNISNLESKAKQMTDEYKNSFKLIDSQKEEINLHKNMISDLQKGSLELKNIIKMNKTKDEYMKGEIKKHHKTAEGLQLELNKLNHTLES